MQNLMEFGQGWGNLDGAFILRIVQILSSAQSLVNVCRPATAILKKLVEADPSSAPPGQASPAGTQQSSVYRYGFRVVFEQMRKEIHMLETVVNRLGSADTAMAQYRCVQLSTDFKVEITDLVISMMLINSLLANASDARWEEFISELERLNVHKAVVVCGSFLP